jgi:hypothetical protein
MRIILMGEDCRTCGETVSREDNFCPRCGAAQPLMPRVWHMAVFALAALIGGGVFAAPQWVVNLLRF